MSGVQHRKVTQEEDGMRLDRWFSIHFPDLPFSRLNRIIRKGEVRVDKGRVKANQRLETGQTVRVPPIADAGVKPSKPKPINEKDVQFLRDITLYEDDQILVLNKPHGLAVQGGTGTKRHLDKMLESIPNKKGEKPRLVHRLDRDTSGCLLVAKTRSAASHFGKIFRSRSARKIYWAVTAHMPTPKQGKISCFLARRATEDGEQMHVVEQGEEGAQHSITHYSVTDDAATRVAWVTLKPVTGRTHQLRVHMAQMKSPIINDPRYFSIENWEKPDGMGEGLHLHARRLALPLPNGHRLDITAPLPAHMQQTFDLFGFNAAQYDPNDEELDED
ncbi:RluA family pseudouridine synthase [Maritalea mediterranea]|uniref:Pseudouridine synthase n=1 Tax=Maritalea mediterranea TaxID=2909667 RepID=A0ABS9E705_9HYPH|nr:RluA family pseudouridine synthase [Maritalea mediterranea]MCF4098652.1 RluA family pseudouridine synthase [Maritalea mediterranea]